MTWNPDDAYRLCLAAFNAGRSMADALAARYKISGANARSRVSRLRQMGYDVPSQLGFQGDPTLSECGSWGALRRHRKNGERCDVCLAAEAARARAWRAGQVKNSRYDFVMPEGDAPEKPLRLNLICGCGEHCETIPSLTRHTVSVHRRGPTPAERTPR